jgi:hypothetical protein
MGLRARDVVVASWNWDIQAERYVPFFERGLEDR